jgi:hypothetical protein
MEESKTVKLEKIYILLYFMFQEYINLFYISVSSTIYIYVFIIYISSRQKIYLNIMSCNISDKYIKDKIIAS